MTKKLVVIAAGALTCVAYAVELDASENRVDSPLTVNMRRIGSIRPRAAGEIGGSNWTIGCETLDRDFADFEEYKRFLAPLGVKTIRLQGGWAKCEKEKGKYDFAWLDRIIDYAVAQGLNVLLETDYGNPIYKGGGGWDIAGGFPTSEEALAAWDAWVDAISRHFSGRVRDWAMWNEPDIGSTYGEVRGRRPSEIAPFNVRTAKIIRRNIPDARLAGLSLAHSRPEFFEECLKLMGEDVKLFDWIIYHGYAEAPEESYAAVEQLKAILARYNPAAKLRQGENGCPSEMGTYFALKFIPWSEYSQAKWDMRRMLGDLGHDVESSVFTICDYNHKSRELNLKGLLRANVNCEVIAVKRAYYAVQNVASVFDDTLVRVADCKAGTKDGTVSFYSYRKPDGRFLHVFWTHAETMQHPEGLRQLVGVGAQLPVYRRPGDSFATRPAVFSLPSPLKDPVWADLLTGRIYAIPERNQIVHSAGVTLVDVPVYDSPCIVTERSVLMD